MKGLNTWTQLRVLEYQLQQDLGFQGQYDVLKSHIKQ